MNLSFEASRQGEVGENKKKNPNKWTRASGAIHFFSSLLSINPLMIGPQEREE